MNLATEPTPQRFAALARSSPWRWRTLRFEVTQRFHDRAPEVLRAWVRRPGDLRVESPDGRVRHAGHEAPSPGFVAYLTDGPPAPVPESRYPWEVPVRLDDDGHVVERPDAVGVLYDNPMFDSYHWVAMLDPAELADGDRHEPGGDLPPVVFDGLEAVVHHGRPAWEAVLRPTPSYAPRCSCCALLFSAVSDELEARGGVPTARYRDPAFVYPEAHRVRVDVQTGVCVLTEELGGSAPGSGHDLRIDAVDEPMGDELFSRS